MKKFHAVLLCLLLAVFMVCTPVLADSDPAYVPPDLENLIVFGDSLSDSGNILAFTSGASPDAEKYWQGRFSNGPTWCETVADFMGIENDILLMETPITNTFVKLQNTPAPISAYATPFFFNNAFGGADTSDGIKDYGFQIGAWDTLEYTIPEKSLVMVWIGGNDFLGMGEGDDPATVIGTAVQNISNGLEDIVDLGATHIAVCNLPNLGDTPKYHGTVYENSVITLTVNFNNALAGALTAFAAVNADVTVYPIDMFAMSEQTHATPGLYGVTNLYERALDAAEAAIDAGDIAAIDEFDEADGYLYWDDVHPTRAAHQQLAAQVYGTVFIGEADASYIKTKGTTGDTIGIEGTNCDVTDVLFANVAETAKTERPESLLYGLLDISATLATAGDIAEINIYLPSALPTGYSVHKHINGEWINFAQVYQDTKGVQGAKISADRKQITLYIQDNGDYDADSTMGVVRDPVAAGVAEDEKTAIDDDDDDCFIRSMQNNSASAMPLILMAAFLGLGLAVRRMR